MPPLLSPISPRIGTRAHNLAVTLGHIASRPGALSRAGISERTGLNRSTASSLVDELIGGGLVREVGETNRSGVGRRGTALALRADGPAGLGLDPAGDPARACVVDLTGRVRFRRAAPTGEAASGGTTGTLTRAAVAAIGRAGLTLCGTVVVGNHAGSAALAEQDLLRTGDSYLYVNARSGIGAALVVDGRPYRGRHGSGGEIGHLPVDPNGPACPCGRRGCLERYAGPAALLRHGAVRDCVRRATAGEPATLDVLARAGAVLGGVVANYLTLLDLDRVVLGGVYRDLFRWIAPAVQRAVATPVVRATHGAEAPALGAARSAVREVIADPLRWLTR
jgi:predicted NBD/HSP70 family sugar kinase